MPAPIFTGLDSSGNPIVKGKLCTYVAGTSTPATTYTTSALAVANTNPVILDGAGRATVFLRPGQSYKFALYTAGSDSTCNTGTLQWSQDNILATPTSNVNLDVTGTAGESLSAGDLVYLSTGAGGGGASAGQWYKADADNAQLSTSAFLIGMAPSAITSGSSGTIRVSGLVTVTGPLSPGAAYYASATAGAITSTPPANAIRIGQADSTTTIILGYTKAPVSPRGPPCGRLTLTTATPVTSADVTAAATLYYTPYGGCNQVSVFNGTQWNEYAFAELSIAAPASANQMYDVFLYDNSGVLALELAAWNSDTARHAAGTYATLLPKQNDVYVKSTNGTAIDTTRLYLGSVRTVTASQFNDSLTLRHVWNYYNRVPRALRRADATASWNYTLATVRQANGSAANQVSTVVGVAEVPLDLSLHVVAISTTGENISAGIGQGSTTTYVEGVWQAGSTAAVRSSLVVRLMTYPAIGYQFWSWNEYSTAAGVTTWYGTTSLGSTITGGLRGWILG